MVAYGTKNKQFLVKEPTYDEVRPWTRYKILEEITQSFYGHRKYEIVKDFARFTRKIRAVVTHTRKINDKYFVFGIIIYKNITLRIL